MISKAEPLCGFYRAVWFSYDYLWRYLLAGLLPIFLVGLKVAFDESVWYLLGAHIISAILILPGAIVLNFAGLHLLPSRTWTDDPRRPRLAGILSVPLIWAVFLLGIDHIDSGGFLRDPFGIVGGIFIHICSILFVCSSISLAVAWVLPPNRRIPIRRSRLLAGSPPAGMKSMQSGEGSARKGRTLSPP
jgi:hypothetical protein